MATPVPSSPPTQPTRQQLDELDALMQRMLALPVEGLAVPAPPPALPQSDNGPSTDEPASAAGDSGPVLLVDLTPGTDQPAADVLPQAFHTFVSVPAPELPVIAAPPSSRDEPECLVDAGAAPPEPAASQQAEEGPAWYQLPLVGMNRVFDGTTWLLGPLGRWLRAPAGRTLLGWLGLLLLAGALAWGILDWVGWSW
jgi:hypothetical protein